MVKYFSSSEAEGREMTRYGAKVTERPYITDVADEGGTWGITTNNGENFSYSKNGNPEPTVGDECRLYTKFDVRNGLILSKLPDEAYDIVLVGIQQPRFSRLSQEREILGISYLFKQVVQA